MGKRNRTDRQRTVSSSNIEVSEKQKVSEEKRVEKDKDVVNVKPRKKIRKKVNKEIPDLAEDKIDSDSKTNLKNNELEENNMSAIDKPLKEKLIKNNKVKKSKKIIFVDNVSEEVASTHGHTSKQNEIENEDMVKDEDIDKFCDELSPADNEQFETWVKMIEAKLHSKK